MEEFLREEHFLNSTQVIVACSGDSEWQTKIFALLATERRKILILNQKETLPFISEYAPDQAGIDRLANVAAGIEYAGGAAIVVDAGSAITLEVIGPDLSFLGGAILPGFGLQARALQLGTAALPEITVDVVNSIGTDTENCIRLGIAQGCAGGVERLINLFRKISGMADAKIIFTGGDGELLARLLPPDTGLVIPGHTLRGIYLLARHQYPAEFSFSELEPT